MLGIAACKHAYAFLPAVRLSLSVVPWYSWGSTAVKRMDNRMGVGAGI
jgi:hypothetical protein